RGRESRIADQRDARGHRRPGRCAAAVRHHGRARPAARRSPPSRCRGWIRTSLIPSLKTQEVCFPHPIGVRAAVSRLAFSEKLRVSELCRGGGRRNVDDGVERYRHWRQAKFRAARLVTKLQGNMLFAERGIRESGDGHAKNHRSLVNIEQLFGKSERYQFSFVVDDLPAVESGRM